MENATNGLIMAGSMLIAIIVLSLFVYLFSSMGGIAKNFQENIDQNEVLKFNEPFEKYVGKENLTPHDVMTVYNLAEQVNSDAGFEMIEIAGIKSQDLKDVSSFLSSEKRYKCVENTVRYSDETQKICYMEFKEVK